MSSVKAAQWTVKWPSRQADGRQASYSGEWMETGTSTFLDSDWPSFRSTVHLLSPSLSLALSSFPTIPLFAVEQPNKSCKVNIKVCSQRSPDLRTVDLCAAGGRSRPKDNSVFESCMSLLFIWFPRKFNPPCLISYCTICTSDCFLYAYFSLLLYFLPLCCLTFLPSFKDTSMWKACGLSLNIMANLTPAEWRKVAKPKK